MNTVDATQLHDAMGPLDWAPPVPFGPDGWAMHSTQRERYGLVLVTAAPYDDIDADPGGDTDDATHTGASVVWIHASLTRAGRMPTYTELVRLHRACFPGYAYQAFVPPADHVNLSAFTLHLWGRLDGAPVTPRFHGVARTPGGSVSG